MTWHDWVTLLGSVSAWVGNIYIWSGWILGQKNPIKMELFPYMHRFGWPMCVAWCFHGAIWESTSWWHRPVNIFLALMYLGVWWIFKDDGDDRWKKRRKKMLAKIKQVGRRLVIVPIPQPQPIKP